MDKPQFSVGEHVIFGQLNGPVQEVKIKALPTSTRTKYIVEDVSTGYIFHVNECYLKKMS